MQIKKEKKTSVPWLGAYERSAFLFSSPFILFFALTILIPVVVSFAFSFMRIGYTLEFVGLQNYIDIYHHGGVDSRYDALGVVFCCVAECTKSQRKRFLPDSLLYSNGDINRCSGLCLYDLF